MRTMAFKLLHASGPSRQQRQVPTRRFAAHDHRCRINAETLAMDPHPANRRLHVLDLGRPWRLIHDAVLSSDTDVSTLGHADAVALFEGRTVGSLPPTPRQQEQPRHWTMGVCGMENIDV